MICDGIEASSFGVAACIAASFYVLGVRRPRTAAAEIPKSQFSCCLEKMATGLASSLILSNQSAGTPKPFFHRQILPSTSYSPKKTSIRCAESPKRTLKTCKNCKTQFDPSLNHPTACRFHTAHFGGRSLSHSFPPPPSSP